MPLSCQGDSSNPVARVALERQTRRFAGECQRYRQLDKLPCFDISGRRLPASTAPPPRERWPARRSARGARSASRRRRRRRVAEIGGTHARVALALGGRAVELDAAVLDDEGVGGHLEG